MTKADLIVVGAGPGGYETAALAAARGFDTIVIERAELGGTCLNRGCIPTKALCRSAEVVSLIKDASRLGVDVDGVTLNYAQAVARKDEVVSTLREGVEICLKCTRVVCGEARFVSPKIIEVNGEEYTADKIIIATGSRPRSLNIPGAELAIDSDKLLSMTELPASMIIVGGGVIGMEFASILSAFGVAVTVVEFCKEILPPFDAEIAKRLRMSMKRRGIEIITSAAVKSLAKDDDGRIVATMDVKGKERTVTADMALMAVGRVPVVPDGLNVEMKGAAIAVNLATMETSVPGVYAIGDVNGLCMLAHAASAQGRAVLGDKVDLDVIPSAVFTSPECAMVGMTEEACAATGIEYKVGKSTFRANGKALAMDEPDGLAKIIVAADGKVLGAHICGAHAADLIQEVAVVMSQGLTIDAIRDTIHGHPTLSEVVAAAAHNL